MMQTPINTPTPPKATPIVVAAFYKFISLPDFAAHRAGLQKICTDNDVQGTILLAREGINGTISGNQKGVQALFDFFARTAAFHDIEPKFSFAKQSAFHRMKVRLKKEIVTMGLTMGQTEIDPIGATGRYVKPQDWNKLIGDRDTLVIDTRNTYEVAIGSFENAVNPQTASFRAFPAWADANLSAAEDKSKNIAMFCTGGIRCEKATAYLVGRGFKNVFHLEGGILKYLEQIPQAQSKWQGACFVFDERVSVLHGLAQGAHDMCHACRMPLTQQEKQHPAYEQGVACLHCIAQHSEADRRRFREREKQIKLARARGAVHLGKI